MSSGAIGGIYAALDEERYEEALRLCERSEVSRTPLVRALRSFALAQLDRSEEARELATELLDQQRDEGVLGTLVHTFRALRDAENLIRCHEALLQLNPSSERHAQQLFFALARAGELKRMQQTASLMYKGLGKRKYLFWTVCCMLTAEPPTPMTLTLAEKMIRKLLYEVFPAERPGFEELRLFVDVIVRQGGAERALACLDELCARVAGPAPSDQDSELQIAASTLQILELRCQILGRMGDLRAELREQTALLALFPDQWAAHARAAELVCGPLSAEEDVPLSHLRFVQSCQSLHPGLRGPRLAEILMADSLAQDAPLTRRLWGDSTSPVSSRLLRNYIETFGDRPCCFTDVRPFVAKLVEQGEGNAFCEWLEERALEVIQRLEVGAEPIERASLASRLTNLTHLRYACKKAAGNCDDAAFVEIAVQTHSLTAARALPSEEPTREARCDDDLILLATAALREVPADAPFPRFALLFEAALVSQHGGAVSPHSYSLKIDRIDLYRALGVGPAAVELFNSFGVRYVQLDSLSYLVTPLMMELGLFVEVSLSSPSMVVMITPIGDSSAPQSGRLPRRRSARLDGHGLARLPEWVLRQRL